MTAEFLGQARTRIRTAFGEALDGATDCAVADFPWYMNPGDCLIWMGQSAALRSLGVRVRYLRARETFEPAAVRRRGLRTLLLQGGGNFGDLYREHQDLRNRVFEELPECNVVQLPATLHYEDYSLAEYDHKMMRHHGRVLLMWRDRRSLDAAMRLFPDVPSVLVPDAAFALDRLVTRPAPPVPLLCLARRDDEGNGLARAGRTAGLPVVDWRLPLWPRVRWEVMWKVNRAGERAHDRGWDAPEWAWRSEYRLHIRWAVEEAVRQLSPCDLVVTDRLHAHILCTLLRIPHIVVPDCYGKVRDYYDTWTADDPVSQLVEDPAEAVATAKRLALLKTAT